MRSRHRVTVTLVSIVALLIAACGSGSSVTIDTAAPAGQTIEEFIGWDEFDEQAAYEAWLAMRARIDEMTAECMADHGLEYTQFGGGYDCAQALQEEISQET